MSAEKEKTADFSTRAAINHLRKRTMDRAGSDAEVVTCAVAELLAVDLDLLSKKLNIIDAKLDRITRGLFTTP